jgi:hypothetical protein
MSENLLDEIEEEMEGGPTAVQQRERVALHRQGEEALGVERELELLPLIVETIHGIKKRLRSARDFVGLSRGKFNDGTFERYFNRVMAEDFEKIDLVLNGLLHYIRIQMPLRKRGTLERLLNQTLEALKGRLEEKGVKVFRRFEESLPETIVPEEALRYVLDVVLRYAGACVSTNGGVGISSKSIGETRKGVGKEIPSIGSRPFVEVMTVFTTRQRPPAEENKEPYGRTGEGKEELLDLELRIAQAIVQKNQGRLWLEKDEKKGKAWLVLRLPVERRKVFQFRAA